MYWRYPDTLRNHALFAHAAASGGDSRDMMELCPKAILLNYRNPMSMLC